jgi:preprotein translocase subunit SecD
VVGFLAVMVFMLVYYRLSGLNAVIALALNVPLLLGPWPTSGQPQPSRHRRPHPHPGMAVDANVLIFERIREELRLGKTVRQAVDLGFSRAFMTIIDCHITTLVSAFFLFSYGTGPVKGFAVSLTIGIIVSMFTACSSPASSTRSCWRGPAGRSPQHLVRQSRRGRACCRSCTTPTSTS